MMLNSLLPKEYALEKPAYLDPYIVFDGYISSVINIYGIKKLSTLEEPLAGACKDYETQRMISNIFKYLVDTADYDVFDKANAEKFKKTFKISLFEAGVF